MALPDWICTPLLESTMASTPLADIGLGLRSGDGDPQSGGHFPPSPVTNPPPPTVLVAPATMAGEPAANSTSSVAPGPPMNPLPEPLTSAVTSVPAEVVTRRAGTREPSTTRSPTA